MLIGLASFESGRRCIEKIVPFCDRSARSLHCSGWEAWMESKTGTRLNKTATRVTWGWLGAWALMGLSSSCRPDLVLGEVDAGLGGEGGSTHDGSSGKGGSAGELSAAGKGAGKAGSAARGDVGPPVGSGGSGGSGRAGGPSVAAGAGSGGSTSLGGSATDFGGEPGSSGAPTTGEGGTAPFLSQDEILRQTITRWNLVADDRPPSDYNFHWVKDRFPHPTFQLGTVEGYHEFSFVLLGFLEANDNFDFLAEYHQFQTPLLYVTASPSDDDSLGTFESLSVDFSTPGYYGDITADVQAQLKQLAARMMALD
jgi:hypothetical protein